MSQLSKLLTGTPEDQRKIAAWRNAHPQIGYDPVYVRKDDYGSWIEWVHYGNRQSAVGWEIDHRRPTALGGSNALSNLRALHWQHNASLGGMLGGR